jgi:hypothetical protein
MSAVSSSEVKDRVWAALDAVDQDCRPWVTPRGREHYDRFMNLHISVNYPRLDSSQMNDWRHRCNMAWAVQDTFLPGNCSGGEEAGCIVSTLGAIPISNQVLFAHSGVMQRTLKAALTMFATAIHTVELMNKLPGIGYWMGIYTYASRFVTTWQRPSAFNIAGQIELEEIRVYPLSLGRPPSDGALCLVPALATRHVGAHLSDIHANWISMLLDGHPLTKEMCSLTPYLVTGRDGREICIVLFAEAPAEFSAFNVLSWPWVFPHPNVIVNKELIDSLSAIERLKGRVLRVAVHQQKDVAEWQSPDYRLVRAFLALTPRSELPDLRQSLKQAFAPLLNKYTATELNQLKPAT